MTDFDFMDGWRSPASTVLLQGHRGARSNRAENTLESFQFALEKGCTSIELDVLASQDDILVVTHNTPMLPCFVRDKNNAWIGENEYYVRQLDYSELQHFNVGAINPNSSYGKIFSEQIASPKGTIPTLESVFGWIKKSPFASAWINVEIKSDPTQPHLTMPVQQLVQTLSHLIEDYQMNERVVVQSFDWNVCLAMQNHNPKLATSYLSYTKQPHCDDEENIYDNSPWMGGLADRLATQSVPEIISHAGGKMWAPYYKDLDKEQVTIAKDLGLVVYTWTVNTPQDWDAVFAMNVDGIITDCPEKAKAHFDL